MEKENPVEGGGGGGDTKGQTVFAWEKRKGRREKGRENLGFHTRAPVLPEGGGNF